MLLVRTKFDRLLSPVQVPLGFGLGHTHFGFEANGKRYFDVTVPGWPRVEEGMIVIALLKNPNDWSRKSLLGWVDCSDGSVVCEDPKFHAGMLAVLAIFLFFFALSDVQSHWVADLSVAVVFGGGAMWFLYQLGVALLVIRALVTVRDQFKY